MSVGADGPLVVTYPLSERSRAIVAEELGGAAAALPKIQDQGVLI
jgi:hypothetical protein